VQTLLVVGVDTLAGSNLALAYADEFSVVGLSGTGASVGTIPAIACELQDAARVAQQIRSVEPDWIVHCGPFSRSSWEAEEPLPSTAVDEAVHVARAAEQVGCYLTVLSSDLVCAGPWIFHDEAQAPCGLGLAAQATRCMEEAVPRTCRRSLVARTNVYGWGTGERRCGLAESIFDAM
jgi:dTDP-4-dehydrorhamnose reductase